MAKLRQILLLIWKDFKLQFRHPWVTILELGVPTFFSICLIFIRTTINSEFVSEPTFYDEFSIDSLPKNITPDSRQFVPNYQVLYAPKSPIIDEVMTRVVEQLDIPTIKGFDNEDLMLKYYSSTSQVLSGVVFNDALKYGLNHSLNMDFTIRPMKPSSPDSAYKGAIQTWLTESTFPLFQALGPRNKDSTWGGTPGYMQQGFLPLQHAIAISLMKSISSNISMESIFDVKMQRYPYPPFLDDKFIVAMQLFFPMIVVFSFIYPALNIVKNLVIEKEKKLKEAMKMMGLSSWLHWTAWYLKYLIFLSVSIAIITILQTTKFEHSIAVVNYSNPSVIFVWFLLYTSSTISFCFFVSTLFSKANSAAAGTGVIFFLTFVPYFFIFPRYNQLTLSEKLASCLLPNTALSLGSVVLSMWEGSGAGVQWKSIGISATPDDSLTMSMIFMMLAFDALLYLILTWYIEAVFPGEYGVPEPWYFPFTRTYWCGTESSFSDMNRLFNVSDKHTEFFERDPDELMAGIQIQGLTKVYDKKKPPAVNNITVNMYRGQIMALLGHNGAGKTTTISMLTGLFPPTSGTAIVNGFDISEDISSVHSSLGICPQHDILFDELTVHEHLFFFCKLKGYISDLVPAEIDRIIASVGLEEKRKARASTLSGGMKRKLSVGIALVGGSRIVMLDEPTSGMDPSARRFIWDLLQSEKEDRTILLTTHFMEEADILGDRIAIMADGEIQCCGSPLFLKKKYGAGYHLVMVKQPSCDVSIITEVIQSHVPNAEMANNIGTELKYILPHESSHLFEDLFSELEKNREKFKISSYGASITTMEEVFIKVGRKDAPVETAVEIVKETSTSFSPVDSGIHVANDDTESCSSTDEPHSSKVQQGEWNNTGIRLFFQQLMALLKKRIFHTTRNRLLTLSQIFLPPFLLVLTLVMIKTLPKPHDSPPLKLNLQPFHGTEVPYAVNSEESMKIISDFFISQFDIPDLPVLVNTSTETILNYLVRKGKEDIGSYNLHNMIGADFTKTSKANKTSITALFNNQAYHTPAISLLTVHNALLKYIMQNDSYSFSVTNHPLPRTFFEKGKQQQTQTTESYQISQDIIFGMAFLVSSFAVFLVKERSSQSKHLQRVSGVNLFSYWLASFMWDFINYLVPCIFILLIFLAFQTEGFSSSDEQGHLFLLLGVHGIAALPLVYCCTFLFLTPSTAYVRLSLFNILTGIACLLTVTILEMPDLGVQYIAKSLDITFSLILPNYCLGRSISNLYQNNQFYKLCNQDHVQDIFCKSNDTYIFNLVKLCCKGRCGNECLPWEENFLSYNNPGIGKQLTFLVLQSIFFVTLLTMCELNFRRFLKYKLKRYKITPISSDPTEPNDRLVEDDDVSVERHRILNTPLVDLFTANHLTLKQLTKSYGSLIAVDKLSLGVQKGECFGLLGLNGAGKTTTFKMITGDESITSGDIYLNGYDIKKAARKVQRNLGYCPQFDALIDQLTGRETLTLFSRLRGMPERFIPTQVSTLGNLLSFGMHIDKQVKEYSGGNKRKLSTAVALIGNPPVIFLDEPTTGMDPVSRRCIWNALLRVLRSGRSIILTSHSMEECEALCNRLVIMVNGKLCCLGSPQHLKNKFGKGFTLMIKIGRRSLSSNNAMTNPLHSNETVPHVCQNTRSTDQILKFKHDIDQAKSFVERTFISAVLKDVHEGLLHYHIPNPQLNWSQIFGAMEQAKSSLNIEDYSVGQTTLEQVFLNFAKSQRVIDHI